MFVRCRQCEKASGGVFCTPSWAEAIVGTTWDALDVAAIAATHAFANRHGLTVRADEGAELGADAGVEREVHAAGLGVADLTSEPVVLRAGLADALLGAGDALVELVDGVLTGGMSLQRAATLHRALTRIRRALVSAGDAQRAVGQQVYMDSELPFPGVRTPQVRRMKHRGRPRQRSS